MRDAGLWLALALAAAAYVRAARRTPRWPVRRTVGWLAGLAVTGVALLSGLDARAAHSMHAHMVQHLLLVLASAPLLVAGAPLGLALRRGPALRGVVRSRTLALALHPIVAGSALALAMVLTHVPAIYDAALDHPALHAAEHMLYLATAALFWTTVLGVRPQRHRRSLLVRILMLLAAMPPMALVGVALMSTSKPAYRYYTLADQQGAGRLMWVGGTLPMGALVLVLLVVGLEEEERRQRRLDLRRAGG